MTLRVLNLLNRDHRRGAEAFGIDLASGLARCGVSVRTIALARASNGRTHDVESISRTGRLGPMALARLWRLARSADVLIGHGGRTLMAGSIVGLAARRPFVYRVIGEPSAWVDSRARRRVSWAMRRAAAVACYHDGVVAELGSTFGVRPDRLHVIAKGIDVSAFPAVDERRRAAARSTLGVDSANGPVVLYLGALVENKNVEQVIRAAARVPGATLLVVGDGTHRSALEALARECGSNASFHAATDDPNLYLAAADVVVLTSRTEGVPTVLLEAGLAGLGVVATPVGGVTTIIDDRTGRLVGLDDIPATASAISEVASRRRELGSRARQQVLADHDIDEVAQAWHALLCCAADGTR